MIPSAQVLYHSSIKLTGSKILYIDPYGIEGNPKDADYIFCTHSHYDHFSPEDIEKVRKENTVLIIVESARDDAAYVMGEEKVRLVEPNHHYQIGEILFETKNAYNIGKSFHKKEMNWVGYLINLDGINFYIAGDTDNIEEIQNVKCDIALLPIGGTYTMNVEEAAKLANTISADKIIPTHYGSIVGKKEDGERFASLVEGKEVILML